MTIPTEVILLLIPLMGGPFAAIFAAWRKAESECVAVRAAHVADAKVAADLLTEQRIANVGALSTITIREFERDQHKAAHERVRAREGARPGNHASGADTMSILDRLFRQHDPVPTIDEGARSAFVESLSALQDKLDEDPCAADPTQPGCVEARQALRHHRPDIAEAVLSGRDAWSKQ